MDNDEIGNAFPELISSLTERQEILLTLLPIVPSILSVAASSTIMYLVYKAKFKSPYKRILFGLSVADIIFSSSYAFQSVLLPRETSHRAWAVGNDSTCHMLGFMAQLAQTTVWYNAVLSFYYLLTIRFGVKERTFASKIEPWFHMFAIGYPLATAIAGSVMGVYHELELGTGCWISNYPEGCRETDDCKSPLIAWMFAGIFLVFTFFSIFLNNIIVYRYVKKELTRGQRHSMNTVLQTNRINNVARQAFLYVVAYIGTYSWTVALRVLEGQSVDAEHEASLFPLLVLQAILAPSTGIFNLCIYLRPRYLSTRRDFPMESQVWTIRRALYGNTVLETSVSEQSLASRQLKASAIRHNFKSSLASIPESDQEWDEAAAAAVERDSTATNQETDPIEDGAFDDDQVWIGHSVWRARIPFLSCTSW